jgi:hypothetical protein
LGEDLIEAGDDSGLNVFEPVGFLADVDDVGNGHQASPARRGVAV